jgi:hypothetical protein
VVADHRKVDTGVRLSLNPTQGGITMNRRKSGSQPTRWWKEGDSNPRSPRLPRARSLHPRARHDPRRDREARNAGSFASTCSPCDLQHAWGAFHMDRAALSSRSASDGFEHLAASFSPSRASFEICRAIGDPMKPRNSRFCGIGVDWTPQ